MKPRTALSLAMALTLVAGCKPAASSAANNAAAPPASATPAAAAPALPAPTNAPPAAAGPLSEMTGSLQPGPHQAADVAGSYDLGFLKRFDGSKIVNFEAFPFEQLSVAAPDPAHPDAWPFAPVEGQITRIVYELPRGHTALEALRNYEQALAGVGFTQAAERLGDTDLFRDFGEQVYHQSWETNADFNWTNLGRSGVQQFGYVVEKATSGGRLVTVVVTVGNYSHPVDVTYKTPTHFEADQPFVIVDIAVAKPVANQMVTVKAADMADALATKGVIDLYGIYFDTDKTDVKPESSATLDEVASLLKIDRTLKLEVSGHTDNSGSHDHNMALSLGRAQAVVGTLVSKYGIDPTRLTAKGYGETRPVAPNTDPAGMAKNRRVELRKL